MDTTYQSRLDRFVSKLVGEQVVVLWPFQRKTLASGVNLAMPGTVWAHIVARSSAARKNLTALSGIIDSGYRGPLFSVLSNLGLVPRIIRDGERHTQVIFHVAVRPGITYVDGFGDTTERGSTGFGSSGT